VGGELLGEEEESITHGGGPIRGLQGIVRREGRKKLNAIPGRVRERGGAARGREATQPGYASVVKKLSTREKRDRGKEYRGATQEKTGRLTSRV